MPSGNTSLTLPTIWPFRCVQHSTEAITGTVATSPINRPIKLTCRCCMFVYLCICICCFPIRFAYPLCGFELSLVPAAPWHSLLEEKVFGFVGLFYNILSYALNTSTYMKQLCICIYVYVWGSNETITTTACLLVTCDGIEFQACQPTLAFNNTNCQLTSKPKTSKTTTTRTNITFENILT